MTPPRPVRVVPRPHHARAGWGGRGMACGCVQSLARRGLDCRAAVWRNALVFSQAVALFTEYNIEQKRPGYYQRIVSVGRESSTATMNQGNITFTGPPGGLGLPEKLETMLLETFEFDGTLVEWKDKGHDLETQVSMKKRPSHMAWVLDVLRSNGRRARFYIESHNGHLVEQVYLDDQGQEQLVVKYGGHRESQNNRLPQPFLLNNDITLEHYVLPGRITYYDGQGLELSRVDIESVAIDLGE